MPLAPDSPSTQDVTGPVVSKNLGVMHIQEFRVIVDPNGVAGSKIQVFVRWTEGYVSEDVFYPVNAKSKTYSGQDLEDSLDENTTGGSFYGEIKAKLWGFLQTSGDAPAGTIT